MLGPIFISHHLAVTQRLPWSSKYFWNIANLEANVFFNPFHTISFLYRLKTSENERCRDIFRGYRKRPVSWNELNWTGDQVKKRRSCGDRCSTQCIGQKVIFKLL